MVYCCLQHRCFICIFVTQSRCAQVLHCFSVWFFDEYRSEITTWADPSPQEEGKEEKVRGSVAELGYRLHGEQQGKAALVLHQDENLPYPSAVTKKTGKVQVFRVNLMFLCFLVPPMLDGGAGISIQMLFPSPGSFQAVALTQVPFLPPPQHRFF